MQKIKFKKDIGNRKIPRISKNNRTKVTEIRSNVINIAVNENGLISLSFIEDLMQNPLIFFVYKRNLDQVKWYNNAEHKMLGEAEWNYSHQKSWGCNRKISLRQKIMKRSHFILIYD